jgi:SAM-dependent methyltransferase
VNLKIKKIVKETLTGFSQLTQAFGKKACPVCKKKVRRFAPLSESLIKKISISGFSLDIHEFETLNIREYSCPFCGCSDRDRIFAIQIEKMVQHQQLPTKGYFVEFAPIPALTKRIRDLLPDWNLRTADLYDHQADDKIDICDMKKEYPSNQYDFFLCSHVLEHVRDDVKALGELFRITKKGGHGILMAPIHKSLKKTREATGVETEEDRWRLFAQNDHYRLYSKSDWQIKIKNAGFQLLPSSFQNKQECARFGIYPGSILYCVIKP